jgi:hypothetical protein
MTTMLPTDAAHVATRRRYARVAGVAWLLSGETYLPGRIIVSGDAAATAANIRGNRCSSDSRSPATWWKASATSRSSSCCTSSSSPSTGTWHCSSPSSEEAKHDRRRGEEARLGGRERHRRNGPLILRETGGMTAFTLEQRAALAFLGVRIAGMIAWLFVCMYGIASMIRGYLTGVLYLRRSGQRGSRGRR